MLAQLLMRPLEEFVEQAKLVHELQSGRMNGVAAEVAQEVRVLLENDHLDSRPGKKKPSIMPAGPPPAMQQQVSIIPAAGVA